MPPAELNRPVAGLTTLVLVTVVIEALAQILWPAFPLLVVLLVLALTAQGLFDSSRRR